MFFKFSQQSGFWKKDQSGDGNPTLRCFFYGLGRTGLAYSNNGISETQKIKNKLNSANTINWLSKVLC